jgi:hypothetical protein
MSNSFYAGAARVSPEALAEAQASNLNERLAAFKKIINLTSFP